MLLSVLRGILCDKVKQNAHAWIVLVVGVVGISCISHPASISGRTQTDKRSENQTSSSLSPDRSMKASNPSGVSKNVAAVSKDSNFPQQSQENEANAPTLTKESCRTDKMKFTLPTSCNNDGSVEVCIPADEQSHARLSALVPNLRCGSWRGRAECHLTEQRNCLIPVDRSNCNEQRLSPEDWQRVCAVADLEFVEKVVPTFLE